MVERHVSHDQQSALAAAGEYCAANVTLLRLLRPNSPPLARKARHRARAFSSFHDSSAGRAALAVVPVCRPGAYLGQLTGGLEV